MCEPLTALLTPPKGEKRKRASKKKKESKPTPGGAATRGDHDADCLPRVLTVAARRRHLEVAARWGLQRLMSPPDTLVIKSTSLRQRYLDIMHAPENQLHPRWWHEQMTGLVHQVLQEYVQRRGTEEEEKGDDDKENYRGLATLYDRDVRRFAPQQRAVLLGSRPGCDVALATSGETSRLHALVFASPELGRLFVMDVGSLHGLAVLAGGAALPCSEPGIWEADLEATLVLALGKERVTLNPSLCTSCQSRLPCFATALCEGCFAQQTRGRLPPAPPLCLVRETGGSNRPTLLLRLL